MTITRSAIETKFLTALDADKPCFIVRNILQGYQYSVETNGWFRYDGGGTPTPPTFDDDEDGDPADLASLPIKYTYDGRATLYSSPDSNGDNNNYYWALYNTRWNGLIGASYSSYVQEYYVDAAVIKGHAWGTSGTLSGYPNAELQLRITMDSTTDFGTAPQVILDETAYMDDPTSNPNPLQSGVSHTVAELKPAEGDYRYLLDGDTYFRLRAWAKGGSDYFDKDKPPKIGEVFVGERIQMSRQPNQPYLTEIGYDSDVVDFNSDGGDKVRYVRAKGRRVFDLSFTPTGDDSYGIDDVAQIKTLLQKTNQFTQPFMYVPKPYSEPNNAYFVYAEDVAFNMESVGPFERSVSLRLIEIPPFVSYEVGI